MYYFIKKRNNNCIVGSFDGKYYREFIVMGHKIVQARGTYQAYDYVYKVESDVLFKIVLFCFIKHVRLPFKNIKSFARARNLPFKNINTKWIGMSE